MVKCEECGKEFETEAALRGHSMQHKRWEKKEEETLKEAEPKQEAASKRKERIPFGTPKQRLTSPSDKDFVYRYFNDNWRKEPDRITRAKAAGYEEVEGYDHVLVGTNEDGTAIKGVLMRIPKEFYEEDQKLKQQEIDKVDAEIRRGSFQEKSGDKRYVPPDGIHIDTKLKP